MIDDILSVSFQLQRLRNWNTDLTSVRFFTGKSHLYVTSFFLPYDITPTCEYRDFPTPRRRLKLDHTNLRVIVMKSHATAPASEKPCLPHPWRRCLAGQVKGSLLRRAIPTSNRTGLLRSIPFPLIRSHRCRIIARPRFLTHHCRSVDDTAIPWIWDRWTVEDCFPPVQSPSNLWFGSHDSTRRTHLLRINIYCCRWSLAGP